MSKQSEAKALFGTLCRTLDEMQWKYAKEQNDNYIIRTTVQGKEFNMMLYLVIDTERQMMYLKSPLPFVAPQERRVQVAQALIAANFRMLNGSFEMDPDDGYIAFKLVVPFAESIISQVTCKYMVLIGCRMTDMFGGAIGRVADGSQTPQWFEQFCKDIKL